MAEKMSDLQIGWASCDLTPDQPVLVAGQFHARVSEGVLDPITATALALEGADGTPVILVSCDVVAIPDGLRDAVRAEVAARLPALDPRAIILNATHTHAAPELRTAADVRILGGGTMSVYLGVALAVMAPQAYIETIAAPRIADAVARAWAGRAPGGIGYGLGHAVVGHNRRICYADGVTRMYGDTDDPLFSHVEGYEDHRTQVLATWDADGRLTGLIVNVACPSQVSEHEYRLSADYWHETRVELRRRLGDGLFVLPQNSTAGDQSPHILIGKRAEERMWRLHGRTQREDIAVRIADAVTAVLPAIAREIDWAPALAHIVETIPLSRRQLTEADVLAAEAEKTRLQGEYQRLLAELEADPSLRARPRWYVPITSAYRGMGWNGTVAERFIRQHTEPSVPLEVHAVRLGDVAFATNPFEFYLDYGLQITARSRAVQTFLVQHVGGGTYLPSPRAVAGQSYGAVPASTPIGPEGGRELVEWSVAAINALMAFTS